MTYDSIVLLVGGILVGWAARAWWQVIDDHFQDYKRKHERSH